jgi:type IV fimbrial biogenesis protein FimT
MLFYKSHHNVSRSPLTGINIVFTLGMEIRVMQKESGLTLMELMVTIAIVAILASIAIPNYIGWMPKKRLQSDALEIQSTIQLAKLAAVKSNAAVVLSFNPASDDLSVFIDDGSGGGIAGNGTQEGTERTLRSRQMSAGIDLLNTTFAGNTFRFDSKGLANASGEINIKSNNNMSKKISVNLAGNSRIQ